MIKTEVLNEHLKNYPDEKELLTPFLNGFEVTWGKRVPSHNTLISVYFLLPQDHYKESYGFDNEIVLIYSPYSNMEARTLQAIEQVFTQSPAKGRVETLNYFLISDDNNIESWLDQYNSSKQETKIIIPFSKQEIIKNKNDNWFLKNKLDSKFFTRDLFSNSLPLTEDSYFFGRDALAKGYIDSIKKNENRGVFGLRKTGKTSLLFKIKRLCESNLDNVLVIYLDCKRPDIRKANWYELLEYISEKINTELKIKKNLDFSEKKASKSFINLLNHISKEKNNKSYSICLMFDEIEYISYLSKTDKHWKQDFIEFWQTLWSAQSEIKCLSFILGGVNASVVENDLIDGVQNPLFGIVPNNYLTGFTDDECKLMLKKIGKRMGLQFDPSAITDIRNWYGGHPLLIRQACSQLNALLLKEKKQKPFKITSNLFHENKDRIDQELIYYSNHAISEIKEFYPDDYFMFELLATNQDLEFYSFSKDDPSLVKKLLNYQLIKEVNNNCEINIPVIADRVAHDFKKSNGTELIYPIIMKNRETWLSQRIGNIAKEFDNLEKFINKKSEDKLFGSNSFPNGVELGNITVSTDKNSFLSFMNVLNKCFVESIEKYGKDISINNYFWENIKTGYPHLWDCLHRIKIYRHEVDHLHLNDTTTNNYLEYLKEDFEGKSFSQITDPYFVLQQRILDRLLLSLLKEINIRS